MISLSPLFDARRINGILQDPWVASKLGGVEYLAHPLVSYLGASLDGRLCGVFITARFSAREIEVHAALLRGALPHAREFGILYLAQAFEDDAVARVTAYVRSSLPSAANYCRKLGFVDEGRRREAADEGDDVLVLGMTRGDFELRRT